MPNPPYPLQPEPMRKSWLDQHPRSKIPLGCLTLLVLIGMFVGLLMTVITTSFRSSDVYKQAMAVAAANEQVRAQIGDPIKADWLIAGELKVNGDRGSANLSIPVSGSRGRGTIRAVASKSNGVWHFICLQVVVQGHRPAIDLLPSVPLAQ
jgi:hypothetical protein